MINYKLKKEKLKTELQKFKGFWHKLMKHFQNRIGFDKDEKYKNDTKNEDLETDKIKIFAYLLSLVSLLIFLYTQLTEKVTETDETLL